MMHGIGLPVELQRAVMGQHGVRCEMACQEVGIDWVILGVESLGNDGVQATSEP
ncbi:MAG: hypothetical protein N0E38_01695 [Candidatus Thiodiazotropha endolucinida]|nr:hypothetical protein [Candidatus Thiodiazotropha taylori]MCW4347659.1 hypothetical protein [Candidatus Thiodiazotropha endolucinida]